MSRKLVHIEKIIGINPIPGVDYIITHDVPKSTLYELNPYYEINQINSYLEFIKENVTYKKWFAGHHHIDKEFMDNIRVLYKSVS